MFHVKPVGGVTSPECQSGWRNPMLIGLTSRKRLHTKRPSPKRSPVAPPGNRVFRCLSRGRMAGNALTGRAGYGYKRPIEALQACG
jgi:hypothetical protein